MLPPSEAQPKVTYNKGHIALATDGYNFCWLHPRKVAWNGVAVIKVGAEIRQEIVDELGEAGVGARLYGKNGIRMNIKISDIEILPQLDIQCIGKSGCFLTRIVRNGTITGSDHPAHTRTSSTQVVRALRQTTATQQRLQIHRFPDRLYD